MNVRPPLLAAIAAAGWVACATPVSARAGAAWNCEELDTDAMDPVGWKASLAGPDAVEAGKPATFTIDVSILPDHVLYQERADVALPEGAREVALGKASYPPTKRKHDALLGKEVDYWDGERLAVQVPVTFTGTRGTRTLALVVTEQACNPCLCLFPAPVTLSKKVQVKAPAAAPAEEGRAAPAALAEAPPAQATPPAAAAIPGAARRPAPLPAEPGPASISVFSSQDAMAALIRENFLLALLMAFAGGLLISLTPCVYPMIPITVAVIGNQATKGSATASQSRTRGFLLSLVYVLGITLVYATLGVIAARSGRTFGFAMRNPWVLLAVAGVFAALAVSMFGAFQIQLPSGLQTRLASYQGSGSAGVFVTGLFAGIVAGPCTAPVLIGILLAIGAGSVGTAGGFALMTAFSLGMGVLFVVLGTFSGLLTTLPRSGTWMETVKHVFGVLLGAAALYFVSLAVPEWLFSASLGASLLLLGVGLGASLRLEASAPLSARLRQGAGWIAAVAGAFFLLTGLAASSYGPAWMPDCAPGDRVAARREASPPWIVDEGAGVRRAEETGKPMLIDFWAEDCKACKELDAHTYADARVIDLASREFVPMKIDLSTPIGTPPERRKLVDELRRKYRVLGLPKVVFLRPDGSVIDESLTVYGFLPPDAFLERMERATACAPPAAC